MITQDGLPRGECGVILSQGIVLSSPADVMLRILTNLGHLLLALALAACTSSAPGPLAAPQPPGGEADAAADAAGRDTTIPPDNPASAPLLRWRPETRELHWRYANSGDYNRDGVVGLTDLAAVSGQFHAAAPFDENGPAYAADGDGNGEVNSADIAVIARYFQVDVQSYRIYAGLDPGELHQPGPDAELLGELEFADAELLDGGALQFSYTLPNQVEQAYYWVTPVSEDVEGAFSNRAAIGAPPEVTLVLDPSAGMVPFATRLDASLSTPGEGSILQCEWDLDGDGLYETATGPVTVLHHVFEEPGVYSVGVKLTNSTGLASAATAQTTVEALKLDFHPWRETLEYNGFYDDLDVVYFESGNRGFVEIRADNARGVEGIYGELSYDDSGLRYLDHVVLPNGGPPWDWATVVVRGGKQRLHIGMSLLNPQGKPGLYGDIALLRLRFDKLAEDAPLPDHRPPDTAEFAVESLGFDPAQSRLVWRYWSSGDFGQDGRVDAADIKTYARFHGAEVPLNPFSLENLLDTTNNGSLALDDTSAIPANYGVELQGFNVYTSLSGGDYPAGRTGANGPGAELIGFVGLHQALNIGLDERLLFGLNAPGLPEDSSFWLRPVLDGVEGIASNLVEPGSGLFVSPDYSDADWDEVYGQGTALHLPYYLGAPAPDRDFHLLVTTLPDGAGAVLPVENYTWTVSPEASAQIPAPGVFIPNGPIGMGYIQAEDAAGNLSNKLYFFAAAAPGG